MDDTALKSAREALASGKFPEAAKILEPLQKEWPMNAEIAHALGLAFAQMGMKDKALRLLEKAARLAPKDAAANLNLGTALSQAGRGAEAVKAFRRAVELAPQLSGARFNLALELSKSGDAEGAAAEMRAAAGLNPDAGVYQRELARLEAALGKWDAAIAAYRSCTESEECHLDAHTELAVALENAGRDEESFAEWRKLVELAPLLPTARHHLVAGLAKRGELEEAERVAAAGTEADPANADFWHNLGTIRSMKGDAAGAVAAYRRALLADPGRVVTAQDAASALEAAAEPRGEVGHVDPFGEAPHRIGVLTYRPGASDDLSRALAHAIPALLATGTAGVAAVRHVAPFRKGEPRRADVFFDYFDRQAPLLAELTKSLKAERWIAGELAPDLAALRIRLWTAGSADEQSQDFPLDPKDPAPALRAAAAFAGIELAAALPDSRSLLHFGYGATSVVDDLALEHLLTALRPAAFPLAESEFLARVVDLLRRDAAPDALAWLERLLSLRPSARVQFARGQALFSTGQFDAAREAWSEASRLDPALQSPRLPFAWLEFRAGRLAEAEALFAEAANQADDAGAALVGMGCIAAARRDEEGARKRFHEALEKSPRMPEALFQIALSWWREGNPTEAQRWGGRLESHHEKHPLVAALARIMGRA
ncbi:MAG: tetratricopeptide repeat protein [Planctomycetota bacterium]